MKSSPLQDILAWLVFVRLRADMVSSSLPSTPAQAKPALAPTLGARMCPAG